LRSGDYSGGYAVSVLGDTRVDAADRGDVTPKSRKGRALVAMLALAKHNSTTRERVANLLWPDVPEDKARSSLRQTLGEVRDSFQNANGDSAVIVSRDKIALATAQVMCDAVSLINALRDGNDAETKMILEKWRGDYLADISGINDRTEEWAQMERAAFDAELREKSQRRIEALLHDQAHEQVRIITTYLLKRDPTNEILTRAAMQADAALDDLPMLHRRFQVLREALTEELEAQPATTTRKLFETLTGDEEQIVAAPKQVAKPRERSPLYSEMPIVFCPHVQMRGVDRAESDILLGLREDILAGVSRYRDLRLLTVSSLPEPEDASLYGESSRVFALSLSGRKAVGGLKVTAALSRLVDGVLIWSEVFELNNAQEWAAVDAVVARVAGALLPAMDRFTLSQTDHSDQSNDAYQLYLRGRAIATNALDAKTAKAAIKLLTSAITLKPNIANAYPLLARIYNTGIIYSQNISDIKSSRALAIDFAHKSIELDNNNPHAYVVLGWTYLWQEKWDEAEITFEHSLVFNANYADRLIEIAFGYLNIGNLDFAEVLLKRCLQLNPFPRDHYYVDLAWLETLRGNYAAAMRYFSTVTHYDLLGHVHCAISYFLAKSNFIAQKHANVIRAHVVKHKCTDGDISPLAIANWFMCHIPLRDTVLKNKMRLALVGALELEARQLN
jgi:DNA-binding SARP family transcriptional activator/Tfp pilus assembly protein PilF